MVWLARRGLAVGDQNPARRLAVSSAQRSGRGAAGRVNFLVVFPSYGLRQRRSLPGMLAVD